MKPEEVKEVRTFRRGIVFTEVCCEEKGKKAELTSETQLRCIFKRIYHLCDVREHNRRICGKASSKDELELLLEGVP